MKKFAKILLNLIAGILGAIAFGFKCIALIFLLGNK